MKTNKINKQTNKKNATQIKHNETIQKHNNNKDKTIKKTKTKHITHIKQKQQ